MSQTLRLFAAFFGRDLHTELSYKLSFLLSFTGVIFTTTSFFFISKLVRPDSAGVQEYGGDYFAFVVVGLALNSFFTLGLNGFAAVLREAQTTGTLEALLMTPVRLRYVIIGSALWSYAFTAFRVMFYFIFGFALGMRVVNGNWLGGLVIFGLTIMASASIGIIAASVIMVIKRGNPVTTLFGSISSIIGGVWYSTDVLPAWLQFFSRLIPLTYALNGMRDALLKGAGWEILLPNIVALLLFCVVLFPFSLWIFRQAVISARREGSLAHY